MTPLKPSNSAYESLFFSVYVIFPSFSSFNVLLLIGLKWEKYDATTHRHARILICIFWKEFRALNKLVEKYTFRVSPENVMIHKHTALTAHRNIDYTLMVRWGEMNVHNYFVNVIKIVMQNSEKMKKNDNSFLFGEMKTSSVKTLDFFLCTTELQGETQFHLNSHKYINQQYEVLCILYRFFFYFLSTLYKPLFLWSRFECIPFRVKKRKRKNKTKNNLINLNCCAELHESRTNASLLFIAHKTHTHIRGVRKEQWTCKWIIYPNFPFRMWTEYHFLSSLFFSATVLVDSKENTLEPIVIVWHSLRNNGPISWKYSTEQ